MAAISQGTAGIIEKKEITGSLTFGNQVNFPLILKQGTQLSIITKKEGLEFTASMIGLLINDFCMNFNTRERMGAEQIADLAVELATDYWGYKLEDFIAFFALAKKNKYGKIYDRVDPSTILLLLEAYNKERDENLYIIQAEHTAGEKGYRPRQDNENNGLTKLAGSFESIKKLAEHNQSNINRLKP